MSAFEEKLENPLLADSSHYSTVPGADNSNQAGFGGDHGGVHARTHIELAQHVLHVDLDRGLGDAQFAGDLLVAGAARNAAQDVAFAWRQAVKQAGIRGRQAVGNRPSRPARYASRALAVAVAAAPSVVVTVAVAVVVSIAPPIVVAVVSAVVAAVSAAPVVPVTAPRRSFHLPRRLTTRLGIVLGLATLWLLYDRCP